LISKEEFQGASSDMEGEAAFRLAEQLKLSGRTIQCIIADKDGTWKHIL
jgi:hypothetical protein